MDKVVVYLRRLRRMLVFSGYLDAVPLFQTVPGPVSLRASCTLKRVQNYLWDPTTSASINLFSDPSLSGIQNDQDGGLAKRTIVLLNKVGGWPKETIHLGAIPDDWFKAVHEAAQEVISEAETQDLLTRWAGVVHERVVNPAYYAA
jgi:hypothetical protein